VADSPERSRRKSAPVPDAVAAKLEAKVTVELDTADLDELGQSGTIAPRPPQTILDQPQLPVAEVAAPNKVMIATEMRLEMLAPQAASAPTIVELPEQQAGAAVAQREVRTQYVRRVSALRPAPGQPRSPLPERLRGMWLVLLVYVVAACALAISIYFRFYA